MKHWLLFLALFACLSLTAQDLRVQQDKKEQLQKEIDDIDRQLSQTKSSLLSGTKELSLTQKKIGNRRSIIRELDQQIVSANESLLKKNKEIRSLEQECDRLLSSYEDLLQSAYKHRDKELWFMYVLASDSFDQAFRRWRYFKSYANYMQQQVKRIKETEARLVSEREQLAQMRQNNLMTKDKRQREMNNLQKEEKDAQQIVSKMQQQEKQLRQKLASKKKEQEKLNKEIARLLAQAMKETTAPDEALSATFAQNKGKLPWPLAPCTVLESFGQHNHPVFKNVKLPFNNGVNLSSGSDTQVKAVFNGLVKQVISIPGYQMCVLIQHGEYFTFYCKLGQVLIKPGSQVKTGEVLGSMAQTDEGNTLHFELWKGTEKQNPELWLKKR